MAPTRRRLLHASGVAATAALAGCGLLSSSPSSMLSIAVENETDTRYTIDIGIFEATGEQSLGDARVWDRTEIVVPPGETVTREDVVEQRRYLVRYHVKTAADGVRTDTGHVHYYPRGEDHDSIAFEIVDGGDAVRFA